MFEDKQWYQDALAAYNGSDGDGGDGPARRAGLTLTTFQYQWNYHQQKNPDAPFKCFDPALPISGRYIQVDVVCRNRDQHDRVQKKLKGVGAKNITWERRIASALVPNSMLVRLSQTRGIRFLRPGYRATSVGLVTSQANTALKADLAKNIDPSINGSGVIVGTLSDSFGALTNAATTAAQDTQNRDLPAKLTVLKDFTPGTDEGRAMMQLIADIAPGAVQKYHSAFGGEAAFAQGIRALANAGCNIIVDDVFYFAEPFFQNGIVSQAVNEVVTQKKVTYFSAAGNQGTKSYQSAFSSSGITGPGGGVLHDFNPDSLATDFLMRVTVPVGTQVTLILQWDQPFFSVSGTPGCQNDVDFFLATSNPNGATILVSSRARNIGNDPFEGFTFVNDGTIDRDGIPGADTTFNLALENVTGVAPGLMKIVAFGNIAFDEFATNSSTCFGHPNTQKAIGIAAVPFSRTPQFGVPLAEPESFTSLGGTPLLFSDSGIRLSAPVVTNQPRMASVDGTNTTFFGSDSAADPDTFPNFFGTSAAAPHAAAVAALMLSKAGGAGKLTPQQIETILTSTAVNMAGTPAIRGAGLIDAQAALALVNKPPVLTVVSQQRQGTNNESLRVTGTASDDVRVASVRFSVNGASFVLAQGTTSWSFVAPLRVGANQIVVLATDNAGARTAKTLSITR